MNVEQGTYLSILYCLCLFHEREIDMLKYQLRGEKYPNLELEDNFIFQGDREKHWKDVIVQKNEYKNKFIPLGGSLRIQRTTQNHNYYNFFYLSGSSYLEMPEKMFNYY